MLSRIHREDSKDRPPTARHKQVYEERYENAHREERRAKARDYQRRYVSGPILYAALLSVI